MAKMPSWLSWNYIVSIGIDTEDPVLSRRLKLINGVAFSISFFFLVAFLFMRTALFIKGQLPSTSGLVILFSGMILPLAVPFLHRFSRYAGPAYLFCFFFLSIAGSALRQGKSQGIEFSFVMLVALVPLLFGVSRHVIGLVLTAFLFSLFVIVDLYAPEFGPDVQGRTQDAILAVRYGTIGLFFMIVHFSVHYAFSVANRAERALQAEYERSEKLLYNLLPEEIAARLKLEPDKTIADKLPMVAILFADIVNFTPRASSLSPDQVVGFLNRIFSKFDALAEKHGLEKIKTIGDAYMVAGGMPSPIGNPVHRIAEMALDMQRCADEMSSEFPDGLQVRIGLHAGPAVAGVIGNKKLFYDVWGDTVNTASRMESHGKPGRIQVTGPAYEELKDEYEFEKRGTVEVKGMGSIQTWWLTAKRQPLES